MTFAVPLRPILEDPSNAVAAVAVGVTLALSYLAA